MSVPPSPRHTFVRLAPATALGLVLLLAAGCGKGTIGGATVAAGPDAAAPASDPGPTPRGDAGVEPAAPFVASAVVARRLSRAELDHVLLDVFGDTTEPARRHLSEDEHTPYDNDYTLHVASQTYVDGLDVLAEDVATRVLADPALRARVVPCTPASAGDRDCFRQVIERLGRRLLRRPLSPEEVGEYSTLISFATEQNPYVATGFDTAVGLLIQTLLQDPEFLHRVEAGTPTATPGVLQLGPYELASRMSFLIWGSGPDDALLDDAAAGRLATPEGRRTAARRLLADPRAKLQVQRFHAMWLGYRAIPGSPELIEGFNRETGTLIDRVIFDERSSYLDLFRSSETYLDAALADHYGLPRPQGATGWVAYPQESKRAGILSHGSVLAAFSKFTDTSPTQRGILVRTRLMCVPIGRPPANVNADQPPGEGSAACKKDRYAEHVLNQSCASCHDQMDPIGFGLENFDVAGRWREHDEGKPECRIDGQGAAPGLGSFSGPAQLAEKLIEQQVIDACTVQQYLSFALGRALRPEEAALSAEVLAGFRGTGHAFDTMIVEYVASEPFARRRESN